MPPFRPCAPAVCALLLLALVTPASEARAQDFDVELAQCREQLEAFARLDLDCPVTVTPSAAGLERVPDLLRPMLSGLKCRTQLQARKTEVYGSWITEGRFDPPRKTIACTHEAMQGRDLTATVDVTCTRDQDQWTCPPGVEKIEGAGTLGQFLMQYLNQGSGLWTGLEAELAERD
jgi:hypothetical protein